MGAYAKKLRFGLSMVAILAVLMAGFAVFSSEEVNAETVSGGNIVDGESNAVGIWTLYGSGVLSMTYTAGTSGAAPDNLDGFDSGSTVTDVVATGFKDDYRAGVSDMLAESGISQVPHYSVNGKIIGTDGSEIGTWVSASNRLTLTAPSETDAGILALAGYNASADYGTPASTVTVKGFFRNLGSEFADFGVAVGSETEITYSGEMPVKNSGAGIWTYSCSDKTIAFDISAAASTLIAYDSPSDVTPWANYFFSDEAEHAIIRGYTSGGAYIYNDFTALKTLKGESITTFSETLVISSQAPTIEFPRVAKIQSLQGQMFLENVAFGANASGQVSVESGAFSGCGSLKSITMGNIGQKGVVFNSAFKDCANLESVIVNSMDCAVYGLDNYLNVSDAFSGCVNLKTVKLGSYNTEVATSCFQGCRSLETVTFGTGAKTIYPNAFSGCVSIKSLEFRGGLKTYIGASAFSGNSSLSSIEFGTGVLEINEQAFYQCTSIGNLEITGSTVKVGGKAFDGCISLVSLSSSANNLTFDVSSFANCTALGNVSFGAGTISIGKDCFYNDSVLESLVFTDGSVSISKEAFSGCSRLTAVDFGDSDVSLAYAFMNAPSLEKVVFGDSDSVIIGTQTFYQCTKLSKINVDKITELGSGSFVGTAIGGYRYDESTKDFVELADGEYLEFTKVKTTGTAKYNPPVTEGAFFSCNNLKYVYFPTIITLGDHTFRNCINLEKVKVGTELTGLIGGYAFSNCSRLTDVEGLEYTTVTGVGNNCFYTDTKLENIAFPDTVTDIHSSAFQDCLGLKEFDMGNSVQYIYTRAFSGCVSLTHIGYEYDRSSEEGYEGIYWVLPSTLEEIQDHAFSNTSLEYIMFLSDSELVRIGDSAFVSSNVGGKDPVPGTDKYGIIFPSALEIIGGSAFDCYGVSSSNLNGIMFDPDCKLMAIGSYAFRGTDPYGTLNLPATLDSIGSNAFSGCRNLAEIIVPSDNAITTWGNNAFYNCVSASGIIIFTPNTVSIGQSCFTNDSNLNFRFDKGCNLTSIQNYAFQKTGITYLELNEKVTSIGVDAFRDCTKLTRIEIAEDNKIRIWDNNAFYGCTEATGTIHFTSSAMTIGTSCFADDSNLDFVFDDDCAVNRISDNAFRNTGITKLSLNRAVTIMGNACFSYCLKLTEVILDINVSTIPNYCFQYSGNSMKVVIKGIIENTGYYSFHYSNVSVIEFSNSTLTTIGTLSFGYCNQLKSLELPASLKTISNGGFRGCTGLISIDTNNVEVLGPEAFNNCTSVETVTIRDSMELMGNSAFGNQTRLKHLTAPITLNLAMNTTTTNTYVFYNDTAISTITFTGTGDGFDYSFDKNDTYTVRDTVVYKWYQHTPMYISKNSLVSVIFEDEVSSLGDYILYGNSDLRTLTIPIGMKPFDGGNNPNYPASIGITQINFTGTTGYDYSADATADNYYGSAPWNSIFSQPFSVYFGSTVETIPAYLFCNNAKLQNIVFDDGNNVRTIKESAFRGCSSIVSEIALPNIETIGDKAFYGTNARAFSFGAQLTNLGDLALFDQSLVSIDVDPANIHFGSNSEGVLYQKNANRLEALLVYPAQKIGDTYKIPGTVRTIAHYAGYQAKIATLTVPAIVNNVGEYAFAGSGLQTLIIEGATNATYGEKAFGDCTALNRITLPITLKTANVFTGSDGIKTFVFTGNGASGFADNYYKANAGTLPWSNAVGYTVTFNKGITAVDNHMFRYNGPSTSMLSVNMPGNVTYIGTEAFYNCAGLTRLVLSDSVETLGTDCLYGCSGLRTLSVPVSLDMSIDPDGTIGIPSDINNFQLIFTKGTGIGVDYTTESRNHTPWANIAKYTVTVGEGVISLGDNLYLKATTITLPNSLRIIGEHAFEGSTVYEVDLRNVETLEDAAFKDCTSLLSVSLPATMTQYNGKPFKGCDRMEEVTLPIGLDYSKGIFEGCTAIGSYTFIPGNATTDGYDYGGIDYTRLPWYVNLSYGIDIDLTFGSGISSVGDYMFYDCDRTSSGVMFGISSLTFPSSVTDIGKHAFEGCHKLESLTFDNANIRNIGEYAFRGCTGLTSLALGNDTRLSAGSFEGCTGLRSLTVSVKTDAVVDNFSPAFKNVTSVEDIRFIGVGKGIGYSDDRASGSYYQLTPWYVSNGTLSVVFDNTVTGLGDNMFRGCDKLIKVTLPESVTELGNAVFRECIALTNFTANKIRNAGTYVFADSGLVAVELPALVVVKDYAFFNCRSLTTATLNACTDIGAHAFQNSRISNFNNVSGLNLARVASVGDEAFSGCTEVTGTVTVGGTLVTIGDRAFFETRIGELSGNLAFVTYIGAGAFDGCELLTGELSFANVRTIGERAFHGTNLTAFSFGAALTDLGDLALFDQSLVFISSGSNAKYVVYGDGALYQVNGSTRILIQYPAAKTGSDGFTVPSNVSEIRSGAFYGARISGTLTIPSKIVIGENAFGGSAFTGLVIPNTLPLAGLFAGCTDISSYRFTMAANVSELPADYFTVNADSMPWHHSAVDYSVVFAEGIIGMDADMFRNSTRLTVLTLPTTAETLGAGFISGCTGLTALTVPAGLRMDVTDGNISSVETLVFTGSGPTVSYDEASGKKTPWFASIVSSLSIANGITGIGDFSFLRVSGEIRLPDSIDSVGKCAFYNSASNQITFGTNLKEIGAYAFYGAPVPTLSLPVGVTFIGDSAFANNTVLTELTLPDTLVTVEGKPFRGCENIGAVTVPVTLDYSGGIFEGAGKILTYRFTSGTGDGFDYQSAMVKYTPWYVAISKSYNIDVDFADDIVSIGDYMFSGCAKGSYGIVGTGTDGAVVLPDTLETVGDYAFSGCSTVTGFVFGTGITEIGAYAFADCSAVTSVSFGAKLYTLGEGSFHNCRNLSTLIIPLSANAVASDAHPAFEGCGNLNVITFIGRGDGFDYSGTAGSNSFYQKTPWYLNQGKGITMSFGTGSNVVSVGDNTFRGSTAITGSLSLPDSIKVIGAYAFNGCIGIDSVVLGNSISDIGDYAFEGCSSLAGELVCSPNLHSIGAHAFENAHLITGMAGNTSGISSVGAYAFNGCNAFTGDLRLINAVSIGERAFYGTSVTSFHFGTKLADLGDLALFDTQLESISIEGTNGKYNVSDGVLYEGTGIIIQYPAKMAKTDYSVPTGVSEIRHYAFYGASITGTLTIPFKANPTVVGEHAFSESLISGLSLPLNIPSANIFDGCRKIAEYTFIGPTSTGVIDENYYYDHEGQFAWDHTDSDIEVTVTFYEGTLDVHAHMFEDFPNLTVLNLPVSVTSLGTGCLNGCVGLREITVPITLNMAVGTNISEIKAVHFIGSGAGYDYADEAEAKKLLWYNNSITEITFADTIQSIGNYSCLKVSGELVLPASVASVGDYAFYRSNITELVLPANLNRLGDRAFGECPNLASVTIPDSLRTYAGSPFFNCVSLAAVTLPISVDYGISSDGNGTMFDGCINLARYDFTKGNGNSVDYSDTYTRTPWYTAVHAPRDVTVAFADDIKVIGAYMFRECSYKSGIDYGIKGIGENGKLVLPDVLTVIGESAFEGCFRITGLTFGSSLASVGEYAFAYCTGITELVLGTSVYSLGAGAFADCSGIASLTVPLSLNVVADDYEPAFMGCTGITELVFDGIASGIDYTDGFGSGKYYQNTPWYISRGNIGVTFLSASYIGNYTFCGCELLTGEIVLPDTVKVIGAHAFDGCVSVTSVTAPGVTLIEAHAFENSGITGAGDIGFGNAVTIGEYAFAGCTELEFVTLANVTTAGRYAFDGCTSLATVELDALSSVPERMFGNDTVLAEVSLDTATSLGDAAFYNCIGIRELYLPKVTVIGTEYNYASDGDYADRSVFYNCTSLTKVIVSPSLKTVGSFAFYRCTSLTGLNDDNAVNLGEVTSVSAWAFSDCMGIVSVKAPSVTEVGRNAFYECIMLSVVEMPELAAVRDCAFDGCVLFGSFNSYLGHNPFLKVTSIGEAAFRECGFTEIAFGPELTMLGNSAFAGNFGLKSIVLNDKLTRIGDGAFAACPLTEIHVSSSVNVIGSKAFDFENTGVTSVDIYFNGDMNGITAFENAIYGTGSTVVNIHASASNRTAVENWIDDSRIVGAKVSFVAANFANINIYFDGSMAFSSVRAVYGGRIVLPVSGKNTSYFALDGSGKFALYSDAAAFEDRNVAVGGDTVPVYPLIGDTLSMTGYASTDGFIHEIRVDTRTVGEDAVVPEYQDVHYGSEFIIPGFADPLLQITSVKLYKANGDWFEIDYETTKTIFVGYNFDYIELVSQDAKTVVHFIRGETDEKAEVAVQSYFEVPQNLKYMENPDPGFRFDGWWTAPEVGGERAVEGETKFLVGQIWYARFAPLEYKVTIRNDDPAFIKEISMIGPYSFFIESDGSLYYTDYTHRVNTLACPVNAITGYTIGIYMDMTTNMPVDEKSVNLVDNREITLSLGMSTYTLELKFTDGGVPIDDMRFIIENWAVGDKTEYRTGDRITGIPYTSIRDGLLLPIPKNEIYTLQSLTSNGTPIKFTDGYVLMPVNFDGGNVAVLEYAMASGMYALRYEINDDTGTVVSIEKNYGLGDVITIINASGYSKTGYTFGGFGIEGIPGAWQSFDRVELTEDLIATADYCTITVRGIWNLVEYTVGFDVNGASATVPAPITLTIGGTVVLPAVADYTGHMVTGWHWILGSSVSSTLTADFVLTKEMIDLYSDSERKIVLQCEWGEKIYSVEVDPASGFGFIKKNVKYGDTFELWDMSPYDNRAFMKFRGWSTVPDGTEGTVYGNKAFVKFNDEMAIAGDANGGTVVLYLHWDANKYQVRYNLDGGTSKEPIVDNNIYKVNDATTPFKLVDGDESLVKDGYTFTGWRYSYDSYVVYVNTTGLFDPVLAQEADSNGVVTFYAVWSQTEYKISYSLDGGVAGAYRPIKAMYGEDVIISAPTKAGWEFVGWKATIPGVGDGHLTSGALIYSSKTYRPWDGTTVQNVEYFRDLCSVDGETVVFVACWETATYTVTYSTNGGTGSIVDGEKMDSIRVGDIIELPSFRNASKTGYTFLGWGVDTVNPIEPDTVFTADMVQGDTNTVTFYAVWGAIVYNVEYRYIDTQDYIGIDVPFGETVKLPLYERTGYTFTGWNISGADSNAYWSNDGTTWYKLGSTVVKATYFRNLTSVDDANVVIDAVWDPIKYRISYSSNGGTGKAPVDSNVYVIDDSVVLRDFHVLDGTNGNKNVIGWSLEVNGSVTSFDTFTEGLADRADAANFVTLYAVWVEGMCTITVNLGDASYDTVPSGWNMVTEGVFSTSVPYGTSMKDVMADWEKVVVTKDGSAFIDWNYGGGTVVSNVTVIPEFEEVNMSVFYIFAGCIVAVVAGIIVFAMRRP